MKKLLGIVVLGLLLSGNAYAEISYVCIYPDDKKAGKFNFLIENGKVYMEGHLEERIEYLKTSSSNVEFRYKWGTGQIDGKTNHYISKTSGDSIHNVNLKTGMGITKNKYTTEYFNKSGELIRTEKKRYNDVLTCRIITNSGSSGSGNVLKSILKAIN